MSSFVPIPRRRREGVTDFRARKRAITSRTPLLVVRISNKNVSSQFVRPQVKGDEVLSSAHSRQLKKFGWAGSMKSTPACYLLGMLAGKRAQAKGVKEAVLYNGLVPFIRGSRVAAFVKGVVDSGVSMAVDEKALPSEERLTGKTIAEFAAKLSKEDAGAYSKRFSALIKGGFKPQEYPAQFEKAKSAIAGAGK
ncbi:MAG: 50S ribosomal protein L18 [Nitrososphaerales archaeon]|nr:50S ribosomal protein L18 [Nitrososphaerales archaeon]